MAEYSVTVNATSNGTANTEDTFVELDTAAAEDLIIKRVRVSYGGTAAVADNTIQVRITEKSVAGTGGVGGTIVKKRSTSVASNASTTVKTGATNFTVGTVDNVYVREQFNQRAVFDWMDFKGIIIQAGDIASVLIQANAASIPLNVTIEYEE